MSLNACLAHPEFDTIASFSVYAFARAWFANMHVFCETHAS